MRGTARTVAAKIETGADGKSPGMCVVEQQVLQGLSAGKCCSNHIALFPSGSLQSLYMQRMDLPASLPHYNTGFAAFALGL